MPVKLSAMVSKAATRTIDFNGERFAMRALTMGELETVDKLFGDTPKLADPAKATDKQKADTAEARRVWGLNHDAACLAIACDFEHDGETFAQAAKKGDAWLKAWVLAFERWLRDNVSYAGLRAWKDTMHEMTHPDAAKLKEQVSGN